MVGGGSPSASGRWRPTELATTTAATVATSNAAAPVSGPVMGVDPVGVLTVGLGHAQAPRGRNAGSRRPREHLNLPLDGVTLGPEGVG